jgi:hypothetical protein
MSDYVAKEPLFIGLARAHNPGDVIPAEKVERFGWHDKVEKVKAHRAAADEDEEDTKKPAKRGRRA